MGWEVSNIINWRNLEQKIYNWVHQDPNDIQQIKNRALIVATSPVYIGLFIIIIKMGASYDND